MIIIASLHLVVRAAGACSTRSWQRSTWKITIFTPSCSLGTGGVVPVIPSRKPPSRRDGLPYFVFVGSTAAVGVHSATSGRFCCCVFNRTLPSIIYILHQIWFGCLSLSLALPCASPSVWAGTAIGGAPRSRWSVTVRRFAGVLVID